MVASAGTSPLVGCVDIFFIFVLHANFLTLKGI